MICPHCSFERTSKHENPKWECPKCLKAYNKFNSKTSKSINKKTGKEESSEVRDWVSIVLLIFVGAGKLLDAIVYETTQVGSNGNYYTVELANSPFSFYFEVLFYVICLLGGIALFLKKIFGKN